MEGIPRAGHKLYICFSGITTWVTFTKMQSNAAIILTLDISTIASIALIYFKNLVASSNFFISWVYNDCCQSILHTMHNHT